MKKNFVFLAILSALFFAPGCAMSASYVEGEVLVVLEVPSASMKVANVDAKAFSSTLSAQAQNFAASVGAESVGIFSEIAKGSGSNIVHLRSDTKTTEQLVAGLKDNPNVKSVQPNYIRKLNATPNDPQYSKLWGMKNIGADKVWDYERGSKNIVVAVLDTGIDYAHPDLIANIVIDSRGNPGRSFQDRKQYDDPMDDHGHGTHVAGIIGAEGNNFTGVVGVNWRVGLLAVKILTDGTGSDTDIIAGMEYVLEENRTGPLAKKIKVVNMSLGGWETYNANNPSSFEDPVKALSDAGIIVVVAAGNEAQDIDNPKGIDPEDGKPYSGKLPYPGVIRYENTITVGAINENGNKASYSNYNSRYVHIAAPGSDIFSTIMNSDYGTMSGTSMATPHIAGMAALLFSAYPDEEAVQIKYRILEGHKATSSAADVGAAANWQFGSASLQKAYEMISVPSVANIKKISGYKNEGTIPPSDDPGGGSGDGDGSNSGCNAFYPLFSLLIFIPFWRFYNGKSF